MIIQLSKGISSTQKNNVLARLAELKISPNEVSTQFKNYIIGIAKTDFDLRTIGNLEGIEDIHRVSDSYKLVSKKWKINHTN